MDQDADRLHRAIGRRLRELRHAEAGLTQEGLAARAGFHRTFVGKLERGETAVTVDGLAALCFALGTTLADFFEPFDHPVKLRGPRRRRVDSH
ncbi:helix-turn-helix domain-containing protein [Gemmatimonadota bacterium]